MQTARMLMNDNTQPVRLPKWFRFQKKEVVIMCVRHTIQLIPKR